MKRRVFLKNVGLSVAAIAGSGTLSRCSLFSKKKLNFVLIDIDDLGWRDLTCYGSQY